MESPTAISQKFLQVSYVDKIPFIWRKKGTGIPNLATNIIDMTEDSFSMIRESLEILEMVP